MINELMIDGNLGQDPTFKVTSSQKDMAYFTLAHTKVDKDKTKRTIWIKVTCFDWNAKLAVNLKKGDRLAIKGPMDYKSYIDKNTGMTMWNIEMIANTIIPVRFIDNNAPSQNQNVSPAHSSMPPPADYNYEDMPF